MKDGKTKRIAMRVTAQEKSQWEAEARKNGLRLSEWLRRLARAASIEK